MKPNVLIVSANYYSDISKKLIDGATRELKRSGVLNNVEPETQRKRIKLVPGVFEIPIVIKKYIDSFDAFIALGCVIKGKTPHFDFISRTSISEIMNLSTRYGKPIGNGIITCLNKKQALERADRRKKNKGAEAVRAALAVYNIINKNFSLDIK